jgi:hypothetical protein
LLFDEAALSFVSEPPLLVLVVPLSEPVAAGVVASALVASAVGVASVAPELVLLDTALSDELDDGRLSVMYQPDPLKMTGGAESSRRTGCPVSGSTVKASSWKL